MFDQKKQLEEMKAELKDRRAEDKIKIMELKPELVEMTAEQSAKDVSRISAFGANLIAKSLDMNEKTGKSTGKTTSTDLSLNALKPFSLVESSHQKVAKMVRMGSAHQVDQAKMILDSLCTDRSRLREEDGTLTIPGMFSWLEHGVTVDRQHEAGVLPLIDAELNMYHQHQYPINGLTARPKIWPVLGVEHGSLVENLRMSLKHPQHLGTEQIHSNTRFTSILLSRSSDCDCRHQHPEHLSTEQIDRNTHFMREHPEHQPSKVGGFVDDVDKLDIAEDVAVFGDFEHVPCLLGQVRVTKPEIVHGSTASTGLRIRRTILPWYVGVQDMEKGTLDVEDPGPSVCLFRQQGQIKYIRLCLFILIEGDSESIGSTAVLFD
ncbi:hypothetical protein MMC29_004565 [Sticta canariensis]|nr:hypothetical protein [Sticta canariensis]